MPKQTYKLLSFHGGINSNADPRDIDDNQFVTLQNVAIDKIGRIVVLGDMKTQLTSAETTSIGMAGVITNPGTPLITLTTDFDGFLDDTVAAPGQTYYLVEDGSGVIGIGEDGETGTVAVSAPQVSSYYVQGALRLADATHANTTPIFRGYVPPCVYGVIGHSDANYTRGTGEYITVNSEVKGAFPEITLNDGSKAGQNAIMAQVWTNTTADAGAGNANNSYNGGSAGYSFNNVSTDTGANTGSTYTAQAAASNMYWGCALEYGEDSDGDGSGTWMPDNTVNYKFFITTVYDDGKQESLPQLFSHFPHTHSSYYGAASSSGGAIDDRAQSYMTFMTGPRSTTAAGSGTSTGVAVWMKPVFKINDRADNTKFNFGSATAATTSDTGNKRISGCRIYWASSEDGYTELWRMMDCDFSKGVAPIGLTGGSAGLHYAPWVINDHTNNGTDTNYISIDFGTVADTNRWTDPPKFITYDQANGHSSTDIVKVDSFKTALVANNRTYLGNIQQDGKIYSDRMLKSQVGEYDKFPTEISNLDVITHDGDSIVALIEYADRIFQFKRNTVYVINIAGNGEYVEAEFKHKGITNEGAACRSDQGVIWANKHGCFMYDGEQIRNLLLHKNGTSLIDSVVWSTHIGTGNDHRVGYEPTRNQVMVLAGANDSSAAYIYNLLTKSWVYSSSLSTDVDGHSNFANDPADGTLIIFDQGDGTNGTVDKWSDTGSSSVISIKTKDMDFGEPAVRKKIYKVYVSYKGDGDSVTIQYAVNGDTDTVAPFYRTEADGASDKANSDTTPLLDSDTDDWIRAELVPVSAINNVFSFQLVFGGTAETDFEINDISIVYRGKNIK